MALRDEIKRKINKLEELDKFIASQKNGKEWLEVILDESFSGYAVAELLIKHKFKADANLVFRYRKRHAQG
jgi:hypothetical protein